MAALTERDVLRRSKASSLSDVKRLQCWGMNLNKVEVLKSLNNVQILNLSCNKLQTLSPLSNCYNLQQLYLRKNEISDMSEILHLQKLTNLKVLWLAGNPVSSPPNYRVEVIGMLPQLYQLDQTVVSEEEKKLAVSERSKHNEHQSHLSSAVLALLPLLDQSSLNTVHTSILTLLKHTN